jgi:hypothetical protein
MVGYTSEGASGSHWFAAPPAHVWSATKKYFTNRRLRSCDDGTMRLDVNLGMSAFTGNVIASVSVQPSQQGGCLLQFSGRMGAFSQGQIGAQRRIEGERAKLINAVSALLPRDSPAPPSANLSPGLATAGLPEQLRQLSELHGSGALNDAEFEAAKAQLLR